MARFHLSRNAWATVGGTFFKFRTTALKNASFASETFLMGEVPLHRSYEEARAKKICTARRLCTISPKWRAGSYTLEGYLASKKPHRPRTLL